MELSNLHSVFLGVSNNALKPEIRKVERLLKSEVLVKFWDSNISVEDNYECISECDALLIVLPKDFNKTGMIGKGLYSMILSNSPGCTYVYYKDKIRSIKDVEKVDDPDSWDSYAKLTL